MSAINHHVRRFKSLERALKELECFVRNGRHLQDGRPPFAQLGDMRSREMLANWLLCVVGNATLENAKLTFCTGGDGIIWDEASGETWPTEHVMVPHLPDQADDAEALILEKVDHKRQYGEPYGSGKTLVVFLNAFDNGRHYYELHGKPIFAPADALRRPDPEALRWHNEHPYRG